MVIGNIEDDFHSLGRRIVASFLSAADWEVHDIGNDVPAETFIIEQELGLHGETARDLFRETCRVLVYLDTGLALVPEKELNACAIYTGLLVKVKKTGLEHLKKVLLRAEASARKSLEMTP